MNRKHLLVRSLLMLLLAGIATSCARMGTQRSTPGRIHQVGLVWLKDSGDAQSRQKLIDAVHDFERHIPEVKSASVGLSAAADSPYSDDSFDVGFILTFKDEASRQRYIEHPVHQKAAREVFLPLAKKLQFYRFTSR